VSLVVTCGNQQEIDCMWSRLMADPVRAPRVIEALLKAQRRVHDDRGCLPRAVPRRYPGDVRRFMPITLRVNLIVATSLVLGIGAMISWISISRYRAAIAETARDPGTQSQLFSYAIKNLVLPGEAPIAVSNIADLRTTSLDLKLAPWRADGVQAFVDNATIARVNGNLAAAAWRAPSTPRYPTDRCA
jgi:hypothetical protein